MKNRLKSGLIAAIAAMSVCLMLVGCPKVENSDTPAEPTKAEATMSLATPTPSFVPDPLPTQEQVPAYSSELRVSVHPTDSATYENGWLSFYAQAENAKSAEWRFISPDNKELSVDEMHEKYPRLRIDADGGVLTVSDIDLTFKNWYVRCIFTGKDGGVVSSDKALLTVESFEVLYAPVFEEYRRYYKSLTEGTEFENDIYDISMNMEFFIGSKPELGYCFFDVDGDGCMELIIGSMKKTEIPEWDNLVYSMFRLTNGKPEKIIVSWARNRFYLSSIATLYNAGSSGAAYSDYFLFYISGSKLIAGEGVYTEFNAEQDKIEWHWSYAGDRYAGNGQLISESEFQGKIVSYEQSIMPLYYLTAFDIG